MAQTILTAAGYAIGFYVSGGNPYVAQAGAAIGGYIGASYEMSRKRYEGPKLNDLRITGTDYGEPIPWIVGTPRIAGQIWWSSSKQPVATTTEEDGKGGGPKVTTYTYQVDLLIGLCETEIDALTRIWSNGNLIYNVRADASTDTFFSSFDGGPWRRMTVYTGSATQLPDPTYEAAVGVGNAPAYRGRAYVAFESLALDGSGQLPNFTFEVCTASTGAARVDNFNTLSSAGNPEWGSMTLDTTGATVLRAVFGSYYAVDVTRYNYDGTTTVLGGFNLESGGFPTITGSAAKIEADTPCILFNTTASSTGLRLYDTSGALLQSLTMPEAFIGERIRAALRGGVLVLGQIDTTSKRLYRCVGGAVTHQSAIMAGWVQGVCICTDAVYAIAVGGASIYKLSLTDLALLDTLTPPEAGSVQATVVGGQSGVLHYASNNGIWRRDGSTWTQRVAAISPAAVDSQTTFSDIFAFTGNVFVQSKVDSGGSFTMRRMQRAITPTASTVQATVEALCSRAGLGAAQVDASALASITRPVRALAVAQVEGMRGALEQLRTAYAFDVTLADKLYFRPRGAAAVRTISYDELGAGEDGAADDPLPLTMAADLEVPPQVAVQYRNASADQQTGTEYSDRLLSTQVATQTVALGLSLTPAEAKGVADMLVHDAWANMASTRFALTLEHTALEPGDAVNVLDAGGRSHRLRIVRKTDERGTVNMEAVRDDASVILSQETTDSGYTAATTIDRVSEALWQTLDIPILRDSDDSAGWYVAARGASAVFPGAAVEQSWDNAQFTGLTTVGESAVFGTCSTTLGNFTGVGFDELNTVTVSVAGGTLASSTRDAMLGDQTINVMRVGSEIIRFVTATQTGSNPNVYVLTRLLRGQRGTESFIATHAGGETCTLLRPQGLRRVGTQASEIGRLRYVRAITLGLDGTDVAATSFTDSGIALKPFAPVDLRREETGTGTVITWKRRSRLTTRLVGPAGISAPVGEQTEAYDVEFLNSSAVVVSSLRVGSPLAGLAAYGPAYTVSGDYAERVVVSGGTVLASRSRAAGANGRVYKLDGSYAVTDAKALPNNDYQGACTGMVVVGTDIFYAHVDGPNPTGIVKSAVTDLQTASATHNPGTAADYIRGIVTDGTSIFAGGAYSGALRKLDTGLSVTTTYAGEFSGALTNMVVAGGFVWWGLAGGLRKFDITGGTGSTVTLGETAAAVHVNGSLAWLLIGGECKVFDHTSGVLLATHTAAAMDATSTYSPQFVEFGGNVCLVGARGASGYVLQLDATTGAEVGRISVNDLTALAGASGATLWVQTLTTVSTVPLVQTRATVALQAVSVAGGSVKVYQVSATVGRGYPATLAL